MALPPLLSSIVGWLRAGYPEGVPENDYVPLVALLSRRLSADEVAAVAADLVEHGDLPIGNVDIAVIITKITNELPSETDIARVRSRLAAGGWPLADPHEGT
ncbi:DUF3349 domain-containing protein [Microlunatus panaciterrae]|uniref:DUF3349 domain-containing protein n=1 Tax=Microlunatus panaciterrae TaxID=400768 RepID=A0ABS2REJ5_9ACTN|nr:DUF3349 domain-containing protein [Microlunatus panaciterrae]MBM7797372.1 hypothetical protein [Microlunatus panaciterrae]